MRASSSKKRVISTATSIAERRNLCAGTHRFLSNSALISIALFLQRSRLMYQLSELTRDRLYNDLT
jgi:hypothetical protein